MTMLTAHTLPVRMTVPEWCRYSGMSRSRTYKLFADHLLERRKEGSRTYVDVPTGINYLNAQPSSFGESS